MAVPLLIQFTIKMFVNIISNLESVFLYANPSPGTHNYGIRSRGPCNGIGSGRCSIPVLIKAKRTFWERDYAKPGGKTPLGPCINVSTVRIHPIELLPAVINREEYWSIGGNCVHPSPLQRCLQSPGASPQRPLPLQAGEVRGRCGNQNGSAHRNHDQFNKAGTFRSAPVCHSYLMSERSFERKNQRGNLKYQSQTARP
jgi:hypothetical protein